MDLTRLHFQWIASMNNCQRSAGFTLLEVMVALTVFVAIALTLSQTASQSVDTTLYLQEKTLASMVAENKLNTLRLEGMPAVGERKETTRLADRQWQLTTKVEKTEFPDTHRVTVSVALASSKDSPLMSLVTIIGKH